MIERHLPVLIPLVYLLGALLIPLLGFWKRALVYPLALLSGGTAAILTIWGLTHTVKTGTIRYDLGGWAPPIGIEYVLDPLAAFMVTVIAVVALFVLVHARSSVERELSDRQLPFYSVVMLLLCGFSGIVVTGDLFNLFVFLEISSLAGYALVAVGEKRAPVAAFRYLLLGSLGASFFLLGVGFLYMMTGSLNIADVSQILPASYFEPVVIVGLVLIIVGISIKMALFPMHGWLPDAYTFAPSTGSALLAPVGTKVGAYVLLRVLFYLFEPSYVRDSLPVTEVLVWLAAAAILFGSIMAMAQNELKRMLAYSSVAQIGFIGLGIGLANPLGFIGAVLHVLNHAFMKACLFLVAGNLRASVGHSSIPMLDEALRRRMPWTMAAFTVSALSMIGIPPLAGFFSKWYLVLSGIEEARWALVTVILVSSLLNAVYFFRVLEKVYMRTPGSEEATKQEQKEGDGSGSRTLDDVRMLMLAPTVALAVGLLVLGLMNAFIVKEVISPMLPPTF